jgi:hypothetical protein
MVTWKGLYQVVCAGHGAAAQPASPPGTVWSVVIVGIAVPTVYVTVRTADVFCAAVPEPQTIALTVKEVAVVGTAMVPPLAIVVLPQVAAVALVVPIV